LFFFELSRLHSQSGTASTATQRALRNFVETFPLFASAVLIAYVANTHKAIKTPGQQRGNHRLDVLFETNSFAATE
jgi:hypothetical protein